MPGAWRLLSFTLVALAESEETSCFQKGVLYRDASQAVVAPEPAGGYQASAEACQDACRLSSGCKTFSYDATLTPGHTGGACWFLNGTYTEVPSLLATSGPQVCPGSGASVTAGKAAAGPASSTIAPILVSAKEVFTNSANEHAVGGIPGSVGQVTLDPYKKGHFSSLDVTTLTVLMLVAFLCVVVNCYCCLTRGPIARKRTAKRAAAAAADAEEPSPNQVAKSFSSSGQLPGVLSAPQMVPSQYTPAPNQSQQYYTSQPMYYQSQPTWAAQPAVMTYQPVPQAVDQASVSLLQRPQYPQYS